MKVILIKENGNVTLITPLEGKIDEIIKQYKNNDILIIDHSLLPNKKLLNVWDFDKKNVFIDIKKAKEYIHGLRRKKRNIDFKDYDRLSTVPELFNEVEAKRKEIREIYKTLQENIDNATSAEQLEEILNTIINGHS